MYPDFLPEHLLSSHETSDQYNPVRIYTQPHSSRNPLIPEARRR